jgi:DNA-binding HxlR family transcriptional regulator
MRTYGQYCPIARTSELFAERWTPILVRNLLAGCETFGQLMDGAPGISRALLAQRLELLERHGIITKTKVDDGRIRYTYSLTDKGREMKAITDAMGTWGARWVEVEPHHADAAYVLWATSKLADLSLLPERGLTVRVHLADRPKEVFWMLLRRPYPEVCTTHPGRDEELIIRTNSETLAHWHLRHIAFPEAARAGTLVIEGSARHRRAFLHSLRPSPFAHVQPARAT